MVDEVHQLAEDEAEGQHVGALGLAVELGNARGRRGPCVLLRFVRTRWTGCRPSNLFVNRAASGSPVTGFFRQVMRRTPRVRRSHCGGTP